MSKAVLLILIFSSLAFGAPTSTRARTACERDFEAMYRHHERVVDFPIEALAKTEAYVEQRGGLTRKAHDMFKSLLGFIPDRVMRAVGGLPVPEAYRIYLGRKTARAGDPAQVLGLIHSLKLGPKP